MELFQLDGTQWESRGVTGNAVPFAERPVESRFPAFGVTVPTGGTTVFLLRTADLQSSSIQLEVAEAEHFWDGYRDRTLLLGLAFGFFAALILYNAIVYLVNRDLTYLVYALYMTAFAVNQLAQERLLVEYVQPHRPYGFFWFIVFGGLTAALGVEFFRRLIETRSRMPRADAGMRIIEGALAAVVLSGFIVPGPIPADILNVLSLAAMGFIVYVLTARVLQRDALALACLAGSLLYLAGTTAEIVVVLFPVRVTDFALHGQLYGALVQVLILAFALGTKTHRIQVEHNRVQMRFRSELEKRVRDRTMELEAATERLQEETVTDELTSLYNRKELTRRSGELDRILKRKAHAGQSYSVTVAYIDLDNFKQCNDSFGHGFGDDLLRRLADVLRTHSRGYDLGFRVGGDEFVVIMPDTTRDEGAALVRRVQEGFASVLPEDTSVSISAGLADTSEVTGESIATAIEKADAALLASKARGKSRITIHEDASRGKPDRKAPRTPKQTS
jgi:diguanylate cyclase (GGDEF)-like protein